MRTVKFDRRDHYRNKVFPSPFHAGQKALNELQEWGRWFDYLSVPAYYCSTMEYFAGRNACGVFDLTPMVKHRISGPDALPYLNRLVTREVGKIAPGRVGYAVWCDDQGQVIDDGTVFHLDDQDYRICSQEHHIDWLLINAAGFDVQVREETHDVAALAVQGPTSCATLKRMGLAGIEDLKPFSLARFDFEGAELMVSRTGFTGDLGYELWIDPDHAEALWNRLFEAGEPHGIQPMGSDALEMLRIEAGFIMAGVEFMPAMQTVRTGHTRSPFELGLGWLVDFSKPLFNGRRALLREQQNGSRFTLARLDIEDNKPAQHAYVFDLKNNNIGWVTSAMWSPSAKKNIALATVAAPHGRIGEELQAEIYYQRELKWNRKMARAVVVSDPFWDPPRRRLTPPADF
ncbi:MAG TPA: aminomethyltransferase family protein [Xanthomonadales bacterium]|nr:aminomethyltransferase family protein [Xanthomonadales bacterium]